MKQNLTKLCILLIIIILIPCVITLLISGEDSKSNHLNDDDTISITATENGVDKEYSLNTYIMMAMAADIPVTYEIETLKAQATIIRTYVYLIASQKNTYKLNAIDIGLNYESLDQAKLEWGTKAAENEKRLTSAIEETAGMVIMSEDQLIIPLFHPVSTGMTRSAKVAINQDVSYLTAVESKGDVQSSDYLAITSVDKQDVVDKIEESYPECTVTADTIFDDIIVNTRAEDGYVETVKINDEEITGEDFAKCMGLNSTNFYIESFENAVRFICKGKGHGLGLSQYGANFKALQGYDYKEILEFYFSGTNVKELVK